MPEPILNRIRIILFDSRTLVRAGFRLILERFPQLQVVGETGRLPEAVELIRRIQPNIVLFDCESNDLLDLDAIPQLIAAYPKARLIFVTGSSHLELHQRAIELGALGIVHQAQPVDVLIKAIEMVDRGEVWLEQNHRGERVGQNDQS